MIYSVVRWLVKKLAECSQWRNQPLQSCRNASQMPFMRGILLQITMIRNCKQYIYLENPRFIKISLMCFRININNSKFQIIFHNREQKIMLIYYLE